ncbi:30S ribosomal protein S3 [Candidatus Phytoplasma luffae]|uniref:Small ribosomal subunit protein uS3 n=1 Tax=Loofah witches'-broom phytoplasma TaxID=35773 RepID=A0A975ILW9_LOWBP|nr:30S ribosomal protein S3 [Candidatus Phytoplasma luffae]QTX02783.1 30S ribosomal protein S3 [Candidatus Phytoplasma luffae]
MGQKSNPNGLRLGIIRNWDSEWYTNDKEVPILVVEDFKIRDLIKKSYPKGVVSKVIIKRLKKSNDDIIQIDLYITQIGIFQGSDNKNKEKLVKKINKLINKKVDINVFEIKAINKISSLVAQNIATQLQQRAFYRTVQKAAMQRCLKSGVKGVKIIISGRLGGAEKARQESVSMGAVPLNTLRSDIDYAFEEAHTTYGVVGVKVLINHGQVLPNQTIADTRKIFASSFTGYDKKKYINKKNIKENKNFKTNK